MGTACATVVIVPTSPHKPVAEGIRAAADRGRTIIQTRGSTMEPKRSLTRLAGVGAAMAFGSTLLVGAATSAQAEQTQAQAQAPQAVLYQVINGNSRNACLQVVDIAHNKGNVTLGTCNGSARQKWEVIDGYFVNKAVSPHHCLDGNGADVYTFECDFDNGFQKWTTTSGSPKSIRHSQSRKYLHANGNIGENAVFKPSIGTASRWVIERV